jgi:hypothetical protein
MIAHLTMFEHLVHTRTTFWHPDPTVLSRDTYDQRWLEGRDLATAMAEWHSEGCLWATAVAEQLSERASADDIHSHRRSTDSFYYRTTDGSIAVLESEEVVGILNALGVDPSDEIAGINGFLYVGKGFHNFVPREALIIADKILQEEDLADSRSPATDASVIPLENCVILAKNNRAVMLRYDTGAHGFERERSLVLERNRLEQEKLFPPSEFAWEDEIDGGRFERLIHDLLECEPGVREIRSVGNSSEGDGGRDLIALWTTPPMPGQPIAEGTSPARERQIIIQCKARKRSVGRSHLGGGILDTLFMYQAEGYFLATSSQPAVGTIDLLNEIGRRGDYFTSWWDRTKIEQRLRRNPQILKRYADIVRPRP